MPRPIVCDVVLSNGATITLNERSASETYTYERRKGGTWRMGRWDEQSLQVSKHVQFVFLQGFVLRKRLRSRGLLGIAIVVDSAESQTHRIPGPKMHERV